MYMVFGYVYGIWLPPEKLLPLQRVSEKITDGSTPSGFFLGRGEGGVILPSSGYIFTKEEKTMKSNLKV